MVWIKSLVIKRFQSYKDVILYFDSGINIIQGETNKGKSSIIRSLSSLFYNNPKGTHLIQHGSDNYFIEATLNNDIKIAKERKKNSNKYIVTFPDGRTEKFSSFGNDVPKIITELLESPTFNVDNTKEGEIILNIASQLEPHFLITSTGTIKSKVLTKLTGGHIIDEAIKRNNYDIQKNNQKNDELTKELKKIEEALSSLNSLDDSVTKVEKLLSLISQYKKLKESFRHIETQLNTYRENQQLLSNARSKYKALNEHNFNNLLLKITNYNNGCNNFKYRNNTLTDYQIVVSKLSNHEKLLSKLTPSNQINGLLNQYFEEERKHISLSKYSSQYNLTCSDLEFHKNKANELTTSHELLTHSLQWLKRTDRLKQAVSVYQNVDNVRKRICNGETYLSKFTNLTKLTSLISQYYQEKEQNISLFKLNNQYINLNSQSKSLNDNISLLNKASLIQSKTNSLSTKKLSLINSKNYQDIYKKNFDESRKINEDIVLVDNQLYELNVVFNSFETCPLCGQHMGGNS